MKNNDFKRFEFKFAQEKYILDEFMKAAKEYLLPDTNSEAAPYRVDSVYFDCKDYHDYHDKVNGNLIRGKFRVRSYGNIEQSKSIFIEYKGKNGDFVNKIRVPITLDDYHEIIKSSIFDFELKNFLPFPKYILSEIYRRPSLQPKTIVTYERKGFFYMWDSRVRITIDTDIRSCAFSEVYSHNEMFQMRGGLSVMEIKFENNLPLVINEKIKEFNLLRVSNSKAEFSFSENLT